MVGEEICPPRASSRAVFVIWVLKYSRIMESIQSTIASFQIMLNQFDCHKTTWPLSVTLFIQIQLIILFLGTKFHQHQKNTRKQIYCSLLQKAEIPETAEILDNFRHNWVLRNINDWIYYNYKCSKQLISAIGKSIWLLGQFLGLFNAILELFQWNGLPFWILKR